MTTHLASIENAGVKKMLTSVLSMYEDYTFFSAPTYSGFDDDCDGFEEDFFKLLTDERNAFLAGETVSAADALAKLRK